MKKTDRDKKETKEKQRDKQSEKKKKKKKKKKKEMEEAAWTWPPRLATNLQAQYRACMEQEVGKFPNGESMRRIWIVILF